MSCLLRNLVFLILPISLFALLPTSCYSQELVRNVISSGGDQHSAGDLNLCISLGEAVSGPISSSTIHIQQGFIQNKDFNVSINQPSIQQRYTFYPNPATAYLIITHQQIHDLQKAAYIRIYSQEGSFVASHKLDYPQTFIPVTGNVSGQYTLTFYSDQAQLLGSHFITIQNP